MTFWSKAEAAAVTSNNEPTIIQHLHNLAPQTFPLPSEEASVQTTASNQTQAAMFSETASKIEAMLNPYAGQRQSPVLDAIEYIHTASLDMLRCHDKRIPPILRDMYKILLRENNKDACTKMSIVFNLYIRSIMRLTFYKDAILLGTGVMASTVPKFIPLDRGVRAVTITMDDVFNDIQWYRQNHGGQSQIGIYENPHFRLARTILVEVLREYMGNDSPLFREIPIYDVTDENTINTYVNMYLKKDDFTATNNLTNGSPEPQLTAVTQVPIVTQTVNRNNNNVINRNNDDMNNASTMKEDCSGATLLDDNILTSITRSPFHIDCVGDREKYRAYLTDSAVSEIPAGSSSPEKLSEPMTTNTQQPSLVVAAANDDNGCRIADNDYEDDGENIVTVKYGKNDMEQQAQFVISDNLEFRLVNDGNKNAKYDPDMERSIIEEDEEDEEEEEEKEGGEKEEQSNAKTATCGTVLVKRERVTRELRREQRRLERREKRQATVMSNRYKITSPNQQNIASILRSTEGIYPDDPDDDSNDNTVLRRFTESHLDNSDRSDGGKNGVSILHNNTNGNNNDNNYDDLPEDHCSDHSRFDDDDDDDVDNCFRRRDDNRSDNSSGNDESVFPSGVNRLDWL